MDSSQTQNTSLQRLQNVEKTIVRVLELAGGVVDELASPTGSRKEFINNHCLEFMQMIKDIQFTLRNEIKSACEYRPFEKYYKLWVQKLWSQGTYLLEMQILGHSKRSLLKNDTKRKAKE